MSTRTRALRSYHKKSYLLCGEVFRRLALESSVSGLLGGVFGLLDPPPSLPLDPVSMGEPADPNPDPADPRAIVPKELFASIVPFLGGLPILFPLFENLVVPLFVGLTGPPFGLITDELELFSDIFVSILSGFPDPTLSPLIGIIFAGESLR